MCTPVRLAIVAALCGLASHPIQSQAAPAPQEFGYRRSGSISPTVFRGLIQPMSGSTVRGIAVIVPRENGSGFSATVELVGATPGTYSWDIHVGTCATKGGALLGSKSEYSTLQVGPEGSGRTTVAIGSVPPPSGGNFHVVIHATSDPKNEGNIVGCGELLNTGI
jgi:hypothetical protein